MVPFACLISRTFFASQRCFSLIINQRTVLKYCKPGEYPAHCCGLCGMMAWTNKILMCLIDMDIINVWIFIVRDCALLSWTIYMLREI